MTICVFPGTFNPIHEGHLKMAEFAIKNYGFEKIIFIPSYIPPHKNIDNNLAKHRFNMVKIATKLNPKFEVSDIEYNSEKKSYSLITVKKIIEQYKLQTRLNFIIGTDAFINLDNWYKAEELKDLVHFIVFPRRGDDIDKICIEQRIKGWDFEIARMNYVDISSTEIRNGVTESIVGDYIKKNGLYKI